MVLISGSYVNKMPKKNSRKLIPKLRKGTLGQFGYTGKEPSISKRRRCLSKAGKSLGFLVVIRKLNAVYVLNKNTNPTIAKRFKADRNWASIKHKKAKKMKK